MNDPPAAPRAPTLHLFCARGKEAWHVHCRPGWLPPTLRPFFDAEGETAPLELLDFEALDELMSIRGTSYDKRLSRLGGVELEARGDAARVLGTWLATSLASGVRPSR